MIERYTPKNDDVGYGRPPQHTRFKKGQSGNPSGRPRSEPEPISATTLLADELQSTIFVTENGRTVKITKVGLLIKQALNNAITKDADRVLRLLMKDPDKWDRLVGTSTKKHPRVREDISKLSFEEKLAKMKEIIANSK